MRGHSSYTIIPMNGSTNVGVASPTAEAATADADNTSNG
jgi:hypothetical protein